MMYLSFINYNHKIDNHYFVIVQTNYNHKIDNHYFVIVQTNYNHTIDDNYFVFVVEMNDNHNDDVDYVDVEKVIVLYHYQQVPWSMITDNRIFSRNFAVYGRLR
jgi:hypothetical protein